MSAAHRQLGESSQALNLLQQCSLPNSQYIHNLIALEKGYHFMHIGDFANAQLSLESISWQTNQTDPIAYYLAQLQLSKLLLIMHQTSEAIQVLSRLSQHLPFHHSLNIERVYLKGWALLANQEESQAAVCFEELLPKALSTKADWAIQVFHGLIISYLRQALIIEATSSDQYHPLFAKANIALQHLLSRTSLESSYLILSDFYLIKAKCLTIPTLMPKL